MTSRTDCVQQAVQQIEYNIPTNRLSHVSTSMTSHTDRYINTRIYYQYLHKLYFRKTTTTCMTSQNSCTPRLFVYKYPECM